MAWTNLFVHPSLPKLKKKLEVKIQQSKWMNLALYFNVPFHSEYRLLTPDFSKKLMKISFW